MLPVIFQGEYTSGRRRIEYWTLCPRCAKLEACKKKRMPLCANVGWIRFTFPGLAKGWFESGAIELKKVKARVKTYLEVDEQDLPADVYVPPRQMTFEELTECA